jgi:Tfp pilus assembly protein PilX
MTNHTETRNENGVALIIAMLMLMVLSILGAMLMMNVIIEKELAGHDQRRSKALDIAEAGVAEAIIRIKAGEVPDNGNPQMTSYIFNAAAGSLPTLPANQTALATAQPVGSWLNYSDASVTPTTLKVTYKTDPGQTVIYKYDSTRNPAINTVSGQPIFEITASGKVGNTVRTVVTDVCAQPFNLQIKGAMSAHGQIQTTNVDFMCGYNHSKDTPTWTAATTGRNGAVGSCNENNGIQHWELGYGDLPGVWGGAGVSPAASPPNWGSTATLQNQANYYTGPWDALGMTQANFAAWLPARTGSIPANLNGVYRVDNDNTLNNSTGSWSSNGGTGSGFLYIDGTFQINGDFVYRGFVYVNGQFQHQGRIWVLGGMSVNGQWQTQNVTGAILYSADAINYYLTQYSGTYVRLAYRELN